MIKVHSMSSLSYLEDKLSLIWIPVIPDTVVSCFVFQEQFSEMRISINQRPGHSRNFGFTTNWSSSGVFVQTVEEGKCVLTAQVFLSLRLIYRDF